MEIRKGDKVVVIAGDDRGSQGEVQRVIRAKWGKGRAAGERNPLRRSCRRWPAST